MARLDTLTAAELDYVGYAATYEMTAMALRQGLHPDAIAFQQALFLPDQAGAPAEWTEAKRAGFDDAVAGRPKRPRPG